MTAKNDCLIRKIDTIKKKKGKSSYEIVYEQRKLKRAYIYSRGSEEYDDIITIKLVKGGVIGVGECSPFPSFFGWSVEKVLIDLEKLADQALLDINFIEKNQHVVGPAKSCLDLALIDLQCQQEDRSVFGLFCLKQPHTVTISHTVEYEALNILENRLCEMKKLPLLKVKLGSDGLDEARLNLVRAHCPTAEVIVDVNEAWTFSYLNKIMPCLQKANVKMIEQPLRQGEDYLLKNYSSPIPIYADESFSDIDSLDSLQDCYSGFNIKLDKVGGLTNALDIVQCCQKLNKEIMLGCLGGTSLLSTAGLVVAQFAKFVDLDNHLWLSKDRFPSLGGENGILKPPDQWLWGWPR